MTNVSLRACLLASTLMMGVAGAAHAADCKVGISMFTLNAPYYAAQLQAAQDEAKKAGCSVSTSDGQNDMSKQIADVEDMVSKGVKLLILNPRDPEGLVPAAERRHQGGRQGRRDGQRASTPRRRYVTQVQLVERPAMASWSVNGSPRRCRASRSRSIASFGLDKGNEVGQRPAARRASRGMIEGQLVERRKGRLRPCVAQGWGAWNAGRAA